MAVVSINEIQRLEREERILSSLKKLDFLSRTQLQELHDLGGDRNANRILRNMRQYLSYFSHGKEYVYYLNANGRAVVGCDKVRKRTQQAAHTLLRNQLYLRIGKPADWRNEIRVKVGDVDIICDAKFEAKGGSPVFVEVDVEQRMTENFAKIYRYKRISELSGDDFFVIFVTQTEHRRAKLAEACEGLSAKIYTAMDIR